MGRGSWAMLLVVAAATAEAQGFALSEIGTCAVSRAFAATAAPCADGSAVFWNPAALAVHEGLTVSAGVARIGVHSEFTRDSTGGLHEGDDMAEYPPHLFAAYRLSPRLAFGGGAYVPYGLTSAWRPDFPGRFVVQRASLRTIYVQPTVALALTPGWSIGGGPVIGHSTVELVQALDLSRQTLLPGITFGMLGVPRGTEFARATLEGTSTAIGYNVGVHGRLGAIRLGLRYLSAVRFEYDDSDAMFDQIPADLTVPAALQIPGGPSIPAGTPVDDLLSPQFTEGGPLSAQSVRTEITHPWQLQGGAALTIRERTTLSLEAAWMGWSAFDEVAVDFSNPATPDLRLIEDYETSWTLRIGAEHVLANGWAARTGLAVARSPAPDETVTPLLPEQDRTNFGAGLGVPIASGWTLDVGYLRVQGSGRRGRIVEREARSQRADELNEGFYVLTANVLSVGLRYGGTREAAR
ncbi:MAG TPA: outer membrane protein transport protein [Gemmatimonadaceae bacterium]|nr:outer membrane protein transport protein [Gemmatimonadaceae bacterium]